MSKKKKKLRRYPWEKWMTTWGIQTIVQGRDYDCMSHCMAVQIRGQAKLWGYHAKIETHETTNSLTFEILETSNV